MRNVRIFTKANMSAPFFKSFAKRHSTLLLAALVAFGLNLLFLLSFWNRFLAPSVSGMFLEFASRLLQGKIPYRDFYVIVTPFYIFKVAAIIKIFGSSLATFRLIEVLYRCVTGAILMLWLARIVRLPYALLGTIASITLFSTDPADSLTSYHEDALFWSLLGGFLISLVDWEQGARLKNNLLLACSGICCSICFFTKQTSGTGITFALVVVIIGLSVRDYGCSVCLSRLAVFGAGWAIPATALSLWLYREGALAAFIRIIFLTGHAAKGSLEVIFLRVFAYFWLGPPALKIVNLLLATSFILFCVHLVQNRTTKNAGTGTALQISLIGVLGLIALIIGNLYAPSIASNTILTQLLEIWSIHFGFLGSLVLALFYSIALTRRVLAWQEKQRWIIAMASLFICYTLSWGWASWGPMAFPCLGVVIALGLEDIASINGNRAIRLLIAGYVISLLVIFEADKMRSPFGWDGWADAPTYRAKSLSTQPFLKGIYMAPEVANFTDDLTKVIQAYARPDDPIFIYSYQPLWYVLANRWPPTYAQVHFFDVAPDEICRSDADLLIRARPKVIVDFTSDLEIAMGERNFRSGQLSGQRYLYSQMYELINTNYRLQAEYRIPEASDPVKVFVLRSAN